MREEKGITTVDALIAILIFALFTGLIVSMAYNIYLKSHFVKRTSQATTYIIDVLEYVELQSYSDIDTNFLISYIASKNDANISAGTTTTGLTTPYKMAISIEKYNASDPTKQDLIMTITVEVEFDLGGEPQSITMSKVKTRELEDL